MLHCDHVERRAETRDAQLEAENHVELAAGEPLDHVVVAGHRERLAADAEQEAAEDQDQVRVEEGAGREHQLPERQDRREHDGAEPDAEHAVDEEAAEEADHNVRPRVPAVQRHVIRVVQLHLVHEHLLHRARVVVAEVAAERQERHEDEDREPVQLRSRVAQLPQTRRLAHELHRRSLRRGVRVALLRARAPAFAEHWTPLVFVRSDPRHLLVIKSVNQISLIRECCTCIYTLLFIQRLFVLYILQNNP